MGCPFDLDPTVGTDVLGRSLPRIHPDGRSRGADGCHGIAGGAARLRDREGPIADLIGDGGPL